MHNPGRAPLLIAANRGPVMVTPVDEGEDTIARGSGGLVSGMQAALSAVPEAVWVCAAMNDAERSLVREAAPGRVSDLPVVADALRGDFAVRMLAIDAPTFRNAYNGIANSTLWFVLHMMCDLSRQPIFDTNWRRQWNYYVRYNEIFAEALAAEAAPGAKVVVEDYHLFLVPQMLREMRPDLRIGLFAHTPWVTPEYFEILPEDIARRLLEGMLGADLIGFHTERWAGLFRDCARSVLGREAEGVAAFPLCTDADELFERAGRRDVGNALRRLERAVGDLTVIGRVDRTEPSKNVLRGLLAYRELLRTHPEWRGKVVHVIYNNPSREDLAAYRDYTAAVERMADKIDDEFSTEDWSPLILDIHDDFPAALAILRRADVLLINSVRDGMNLVVQEGVLLSEREPAVVLSRHAGAADVLGEDALLVNPFDVAETANALNDALRMDASERSVRIKRMRAASVELPPAEWFRAQLDALDQVHGGSVGPVHPSGQVA